jgi:hypothetical protein
MTSSNMVQPGAEAAQLYGSGIGGSREPANLGDILERVLDKGLVIAGDIRVNLLDIELLTIKLRLVIASLDTAREVGINWWETDPWLNAEAADRQASLESAEKNGGSASRELEEENQRLQERIMELESGQENGARKRNG